MTELIMDAVIDTLKLIPFLFITYLGMEYLEHKTGDKTQRLIQKAGKFEPIVGGVLGILPQCGFSAAASNLYAGRVITLGTLFAIFLSTSDEMLPILISEQTDIQVILGILLAKAATGIVIGVLIDFILKRCGREEHEHIHEICEHDHCHCEEGILKSAVAHTLQISLFILIIGVFLNFVFHYMGEDFLSGLILNKPVLGPILAGVMGLIPNCAGSVLITQLYLQGVISFGAAFAGLLTGSGVGLLILFKVNHDTKQNLQILGMLYVIGVVCGMVAELIV